MKSILDTVKCSQVILTGPKGVGKSISLLALAVELAALGRDLVYFSSFSMYNEQCLHDYLHGELSCDRHTISKTLKRKKSVVLGFWKRCKS